MIPPELLQRRSAIKRANAVKTVSDEERRIIRAMSRVDGCRAVIQLLLDAKSINRIATLLGCVRGIGSGRVDAMLVYAGIIGNQRVRDLGIRQRALLVERLKECS